MRNQTISAAVVVALAAAAAPAVSADDRAIHVGYGTSQHGWGSDYTNATRYRKKSRRQKANAARKANLRMAR